MTEKDNRMQLSCDILSSQKERNKEMDKYLKKQCMKIFKI